MPFVRPYWNSVRRAVASSPAPDVDEVARGTCRGSACSAATSKNSSYGRPAASEIASG